MLRGDRPTTVVQALKDGWVYEDALPEVTKEQYDWWYGESRVIDGVRMGPPLADYPPPRLWVKLLSGGCLAAYRTDIRKDHFDGRPVHEYVSAAVPPTTPSEAAMRAPESRKCVNCGHGNVNSNNGMCIEFVVPRNSNSGHRCGCKCEFAAPVATAERLDSRDSDVEGDHLQLLRMCLQQFEFTYGLRKRGWDAKFLMDRLRAATEHASTAFETPARESVRAAAEAVGEYLQAPPSMWDTIERLITQRLGSPVVAATRATEELLRENFLLSDITAEEFNRVAAIITRHLAAATTSPETPVGGEVYVDYERDPNTGEVFTVTKSRAATPPPYDGSMTSEQLERAVLIAESRGIDLETAQELVYLRDRVSSVPQSFEAMQLQKLYEDPHPGYDCAGTCVIHSGRFAAPVDATGDDAGGDELTETQNAASRGATVQCDHCALSTWALPDTPCIKPGISGERCDGTLRRIAAALRTPEGDK